MELGSMMKVLKVSVFRRVVDAKLGARSGAHRGVIVLGAKSQGHLGMYGEGPKLSALVMLVHDWCCNEIIQIIIRSVVHCASPWKPVERQTRSARRNCALFAKPIHRKCLQVAHREYSDADGLSPMLSVNVVGQSFRAPSRTYIPHPRELAAVPSAYRSACMHLSVCENADTLARCRLRSHRAMQSTMSMPRAVVCCCFAQARPAVRHDGLEEAGLLPLLDLVLACGHARPDHLQEDHALAPPGSSSVVAACCADTRSTLASPRARRMPSRSSSPSAAAAWRGPRWWSTVQAVSGEGAPQPPHFRKNWVRLVKAAVLTCVGDDAHEIALHHSNWAASHESLISWCAERESAARPQRGTPRSRRSA